VGTDHFSLSQSHGDCYIQKVYMFSATIKSSRHRIFNSIAFITLDSFSASPLTCSVQGTFKKHKKKYKKTLKPLKKHKMFSSQKAIQLESNFDFHRADTFCSISGRDKTCRAQRLAKNVFATHVYVCTMLLSVAETRLMTKGLNPEHRTPCDVKTRVARFSKAMLRKGLSVQIPRTGMSDAR